MAKVKKKRNKKYQGQSSTNSSPRTIRVRAVKRNKLQQWWFEKGKLFKPLIISGLVLLAIVILVIGFIASMNS